MIDSLKESEESWTTFNEYCVDMAAVNLHYIMQTHKRQFLERIKPEIVMNIVSKTIYFYRSDPNYDNRPLIELLLQIRNCNSVFELLRMEKEDMIEEEMEQREEGRKDPLLVWSVKNLAKQFYKQSDAIQI